MSDLADIENFGSDLIEFCNKNNIKHFPIKIILGINSEGKPYKKICNMRLAQGMLPEYKKRRTAAGNLTNIPRESDFSTLTDEDITARHKWYSVYDYMAIDTSTIKQIDIDAPDYDERVKKAITDTCWYGSLTKSFGKHLFIKCNTIGDKDATYIIDDASKKHGPKKIEVLQGKWAWAHVNAEIHNKEKLLEMPLHQWCPVPPPLRVVRNRNIIVDLSRNTIENAEEGTANIIDTKKWLEYASLITDEQWAEHGLWFKLTCSAKNIGISYTKYDNLVKTKPGYNSLQNKTTWDSIDSSDRRQRQAKWRTLYDTAETADVKAKMEIDSKYVVFETFSRWIFNEIINIDAMEKYLAKKLEIEAAAGDLDLLKVLQEQLDELERKKLIADFHDKRKYFERFHFKVMLPYGVGRRRATTVEILTKKELKDMYENLQLRYVSRSGKIVWGTFIKAWLEDMYCKSKEKVDFCPIPLPIKDDTFNLFNGLAAEHYRGSREDADIQIFLDHIKILGGKSEVKKGWPAYDYLLHYLADCVQNPGTIPEVAIVFKSLQGAGKSMFLEMFAEMILGDMYLLSTSRIDDVIGRFSDIKHKLFCILDETEGKDTFVNNGKIKNLITQPRVNFEAKHKDIIKIHNCMRTWFLTNNASPVLIELNDRRFVILMVDPCKIGDLEYFNRLASAFRNKDKVYSFYLYLKNLDLSRFDVRRDRCLTTDYFDVQSVMISKVWRFLWHYCRVPPAGAWGEYMIDCGDANNEELGFNHPKVVQAIHLYKDYCKWVDEFYPKAKEYNTDCKFGLEIKAKCLTWGPETMSKEHKACGQVYTIYPIEVRKRLDEYKEHLY